MKILLATDGSRYSEAAVDMLLRFDLGVNDAIRVVSVVDLAIRSALEAHSGTLPNTSTLEKDAIEAAKKAVEQTRDRAAGRFPAAKANISVEVMFGSPESRVVEAAERFAADLVVIGSHGYNQWERLLVGSVSNSVARHAPCSVLITRAPSE